LSGSEPRFAAYGAGGDTLGARRARRGLQFIVAAVFVFSGGLWYSEQYLRHEHVENLYTSALTKHDASARPILRAAVLQDAESERPNPKYLWALAEREEEDRVLETYERAFTINPKNPSLAVRYGVRLFQEGHYTEARDRFHDAVVGDIDNALPTYLEAAAVAAAGERREALEEALAMVARVNGAGKPVVFPQPLWVQDLPRRGNVYSHLQRRVIEDCAGPLVDLTLRMRRQVEDDLGEGRGLTWATGLRALEEMGRRTALADPPGGLQAMRGASIQLEALRLQERLAQLDGESPVEALLSRRLRIEEQMRPALEAFESTRDQRIEKSVRMFSLPIRMTFELFAMVFLGLAATFFWALPQRRVKGFWTIKHSRVALAAGAAGTVAILALYLTLALAAAAAADPDQWPPVFIAAWRLLAFALLGFAVVHPAFTLPPADTVTESMREDSGYDLARATARKERRRAHAVMAYRYTGILFGCLVVSVCLWGVGHRIAASYYPHQIEVLATGLESEEAALMERVHAYLQGGDDGFSARVPGE